VLEVDEEALAVGEELDPAELSGPGVGRGLVGKPG